MDKDYANYLLEKTRQDYNLIAEEFSRYRLKPWEESRFLFDDYVRTRDRILDLGCGGGQFLEFLKDKKVEYTGIDFSDRLISIAKERHPEANYQVADVLSLPFSDKYFDKVYAIALLHCIPSQEFRFKTLNEMKRVLKSGGLLILTAWNLWQKWKTQKLIYKFILLKILGKSKINSKDILMDWQKMKNCYFHCFTKKELRKLVKKSGFNIIKEGEILVGLERKKQPKFPNSNLYIIAKKI